MLIWTRLETTFPVCVFRLCFQCLMTECTNTRQIALRGGMLSDDAQNCVETLFLLSRRYGILTFAFKSSKCERCASSLAGDRQTVPGFGGVVGARCSVGRLTVTGPRAGEGLTGRSVSWLEVVAVRAVLVGNGSAETQVFTWYPGTRLPWTTP